MKDNPRLLELYRLHKDKLASAEEQEEFEKLLSDQENEELLKNHFDETWNKLVEPAYASQEILNAEKILNDIVSSPQKLPRKVTLWPKWAVAASIAIVIATGGYFYFQSQTLNPQSQIAFQNDIAPGKNGATLTLANGKKILINDALAGNIAEQSGVKISKDANGQIIYEVTDNGTNNSEYNTLSTTRAEQTQVRLPDGTLVFLNAESSLKYPIRFAGSDRREVVLTGEGYFQVAKDKVHPFVVKTATQEVKVLGTHFNINSYSDEPEAKTTLFEGSVSISGINSKKSKILAPGQQALLKDGEIKIGEADLDQALSWKNGDFVFNGEDLKAVMRQIARWYDVEVEYKGEVDVSGIVSAFPRNKKLSQLLKALEASQNVHFKIEGRRILVMP